MPRADAVQVLQVSRPPSTRCIHDLLRVHFMARGVRTQGLRGFALPLQAAEAQAGSSSGAQALWGDKRTVPAALQLLSVPAGGPQQMNFKDHDCQRALKVISC